MVINSTTDTEAWKFMGDLPTVREWVSDRAFNQLRVYDQRLTNKDYEASIEISRNDVDDDRLGIIAPQIRDLAATAALAYDDLIFMLLKNGFGSTSGLSPMDGQYFFDTDHGLSGAQSNKGTTALSGTSLDAAVAAMMQFKGDNGQYLRIFPTHLVVPPQLRGTALDILKTQFLASGATNRNFGLLDLIVEPRLAGDANDWFLLDLSKNVKPFLLQIRQPFQFVAQDKPDDEQNFMRKTLRYGVDGRHAAGYGLWQLAYGSSV